MDRIHDETGAPITSDAVTFDSCDSARSCVNGYWRHVSRSSCDAWTCGCTGFGSSHGCCDCDGDNRFLAHVAGALRIHALRGADFHSPSWISCARQTHPKQRREPTRSRRRLVNGFSLHLSSFQYWVVIHPYTGCPRRSRKSRHYHGSNMYTNIDRVRGPNFALRVVYRLKPNANSSPTIRSVTPSAKVSQFISAMMLERSFNRLRQPNPADR